MLAICWLLVLGNAAGWLHAASDKPKKWDVTDTPGETREVVVDTDEGTWMNLDVSPDGTTIVFDLLGDLWLLPIGGGDAKALTTGPAWDMQPRFSPDGSEIAFTSDRAGGDNVWVVSVDGETTRQISKETFRLPNSPAWSPDGRYIAARKHFTSRRSLGSGEIWLWHSSGEGSGLQLNEKPNEQKDLGEPAFSPDGRYVYFSQDSTPGGVFEYSKDSNGQIYTIKRIDRESGEIEDVVTGPGGAVRPTPSPDGRWLAFVRRVSGQSTLFVHDLASGENHALYDELDRDMQEIWAIHGVYADFAWTPDSESLVFWAGGKIRRLDVGDDPSSSASATVIPFRVRQTHQVKDALRFSYDVAPERFPVKAIRWVKVSPDGSRVVFEALGRLWTRSLTRDADGELSVGEPQRLTSQDDHLELYPSFSRDGRFVVYATWDDEDLGSIRMVPAGGGPSHAVTTEPGHYVEPAVSPDGQTVVFTKTGGGFVRSPLWSKETGIYRVSVDGSTGRPLTGDAGKAVRIARRGSGPHFGAESERVFYTLRTGPEERFLVSQRHDGDEPEKLEARRHLESSNATEWRVSPDGRWVVYSERFKAHVVPLVDASSPVKVAPKVSSIPHRVIGSDAGESLHFSGDSAAVFWQLGPTLHRTEIAAQFAPKSESSGGEGEGGASDDSDEADEADEKEDEPKAPIKSVALGFEVDSDRPSGTVAFVGAKILTMAPGVAGADGDGVIEDGTVVVERDRIVDVGPSSRVTVPADAHRIEAGGKVVMPGIIDAHYHGPQGSAEIVPQQNWRNDAALAFGVTTAHDPSNDTSTFFAASELQRAGEIRAPRLFSTGTILYGAGGDARAEVDSLDDARAHLRRLKAVGAFSVKSYNQPRRDQRQQIVAAARELEMLVVNEGGALFQHNMTMVMDGHTGIEHSLSVGAIYDDVKQYWGATEVGNTPTLGVAFGGIEGERYWYQHTNVYEHPRLTRFVPQDMLDARARRRDMAPDEDYNHFRAAKVVADLHDAGVSIQVGAHGQREGLASHWEMWMFEQGGMTPLEALRAGTIDGARYLGLDGDLGSLEVGKLADIIVLERDPLANLRDSESVELVMVGGRLYDAETMNEVGNHPQERDAYWWE